jgi:hypothetical protein
MWVLPSLGRASLHPAREQLEHLLGDPQALPGARLHHDPAFGGRPGRSPRLAEHVAQRLAMKFRAAKWLRPSAVLSARSQAALQKLFNFCSLVISYPRVDGPTIRGRIC